MAGLEVVELLRVENVLSVMGEECRHRGNDAGPVGAGKSQYELMIGHERTGLRFSGEPWRFSALLYHCGRPCANPAARVTMNKPRPIGVGATSWQTG
jgi:hypothetical protein